MGNRPSDRKKRESYEAVIDDQDGGLFGDALEDVPEVEEDPIFQMRKYTIHFRMMVLLPEFEVLRPGMTLTFGALDSRTAKTYLSGTIAEDGQILVEGEAVPTLTAFATKVIPASWYKTEKSGKRAPSRPDGWNRVYVVMDDLSSHRIEDILFKHHQDLGYSVDELANLEYIYGEMQRRGYGEQIKDLQSDLKSWRTSQKKREQLDGKNETQQELGVDEHGNGTLF